MSLNLFDNKGIAPDKQCFTWRDMAQQPVSKLDDDAYARVRIILIRSLEHDALDFSHACARMNPAWQRQLARLRRIELHQAAAAGALLGADHSPLEIAVACEQAEIEVTAAVAQREPDGYLAQVYRFGMLEDLDHLYRFAALGDRLEGRDANNILQSYTDILPGRPTSQQHCAPQDDLRRPYDRHTASPLTRLHAVTVTALGRWVRDHYLHTGPTLADPVARQLFAEIASVEEQHVTQYQSVADPDEGWLDRWVMHEAAEVYHYYGASEQEPNPRLRAWWARMLDYELGHLQVAIEAFRQYNRRDIGEILPETLPDPMSIESRRDFIRQTLAQEVLLRSNGTGFVDIDQEDPASMVWRQQLNRDGSPSETVAAGYRWRPGTELSRRAA